MYRQISGEHQLIYIVDIMNVWRDMAMIYSLHEYTIIHLYKTNESDHKMFQSSSIYSPEDSHLAPEK